MRLILLGILIVGLFFSSPKLAAQEGDGCDMDFLTPDFLDHYHMARSSDERLQALFEYMSLALICKEKPTCDTLRSTYAGRIQKATTRDELISASADLAADLILCETEPTEMQAGSEALGAAFKTLGLECPIVYASDDYVHAECTGIHDRKTVEAAYAVTLQVTGLSRAYFNLIIDDGSITMDYTFTDGKWIMMEVPE